MGKGCQAFTRTALPLFLQARLALDYKQDFNDFVSGETKLFEKLDELFKFVFPQ